MYGFIECAWKGGATIGPDDPRVCEPLYTVAEAARIIDVPRQTLVSWARGPNGRRRSGRTVNGGPVVTRLQPEWPRSPSVPFIGLAEATVLAAVRKSGVPMQRIRPALQALEKEMSLHYALANHRLYTDGAELLYDFSQRHSDSNEAQAARRLVVIRNRQCVFAEVIEEYLQCLIYAEDGYVKMMRVPVYRKAEVLVDPARSSGEPIFARSGCRVRDVLQWFWAGGSIKQLTREFRVPADHIEDALRVASRQLAPVVS